MNMEYIKEKSVAFTGHRYVPYMQKNEIREKIKNAIINEYKSGMINFYCGMAVGFDMMVAEVLLSLRSEMKNLKLIAVVPFKGQEARFNEYNKKRYNQILGVADDVIVLSDKYYNGCLLRRNDFMLDNSCKLIAYYNGEKKGGTFYTCREATSRGIPIINLY